MMPRLEILTKDEMDTIHEASLRILETAGIKVENAEARELLVENGAGRGGKEGTLTLPRSMVEEALASAPSEVCMHGRDGKPVAVIGGDNVSFNPGSAAVLLEDYETYDIRPPVTKDLVDFVRVTDALENLAMQSTALVVTDIPKNIGDLFRLYVVLLNSTKPVVTGAFETDGVPLMAEMMRPFIDDLGSRPALIFDVCPSPPLMWSDITCQNLLDCADLGIPSEIVTMPELGATSPATLAGAVMQGNAEYLSALVMAQLKKKGAPVIYGGSPTTFDMRYATPRLGAIETAMVGCALSQMGKRHGVPTHIYLGLSDSKTVDAQAGLESGSGAILGALARINNISGPGMLNSESCQSFEKLVIDNEICGMALRLIKGIGIDEDKIAEDVIRDVAPGGHYLSHPHTVKYFKTETYFPSLVIDRQTAKEWQKHGAKDAKMKAKEKVKGILSSHEPVPPDADSLRGLRSALGKAVMARGLSKLPDFGGLN